MYTRCRVPISNLLCLAGYIYRYIYLYINIYIYSTHFMHFSPWTIWYIHLLVWLQFFQSILATDIQKLLLAIQFSFLSSLIHFDVYSMSVQVVMIYCMTPLFYLFAANFHLSHSSCLDSPLLIYLVSPIDRLLLHGAITVSFLYVLYRHILGAIYPYSRILFWFFCRSFNIYLLDIIFLF